MSFLVLTDAQKVEIRHHTGHPGVTNIATSALGVPASIETMFIIELAMNQIDTACQNALAAVPFDPEHDRRADDR